jgi:hypothetical protein
VMRWMPHPPASAQATPSTTSRGPPVETEV